MEFLRWLVDYDLHYARAMFAPGGPYGAPAMIGALLVATLWYARRRRARGRSANLKGFLRAVFPSRVVLHRSSLLDMRLWALNAVLLGFAYGLLAIGAVRCRDFVDGALTHVFGAHAPLPWPVWSVLAIATLGELLAYEFGYWFSHYLFHRLPFLWEFHKVHHSAQVLTTFTEMRQHPVEIVFFVNMIALTTGAVFGVNTYLFGAGAHPFTLLNGNIVLMIFLLTWGHLRHSHIWIAFTGFAGRLFQSPAHHQIHHSTNPVHFDKNLGFALAVWDWAFGTLYVPGKAREAMNFGIGETHGDFDTVGRSLARPFLRAGEALAAPANPSAVGADLSGS